MAEKKRKTSPKKAPLPGAKASIIEHHINGFIAITHPDGKAREQGEYRKTRKEAEKDLDAMSSGYETRPF